MLIGSVLLFVLGLAGYSIWDSFVRYDGYGIVDGRVLQIAVPWAGTVQSLHVREGQTVTQGQLLATLNNLELELTLARLGDDLKDGASQAGCGDLTVAVAVATAR